MGFSLSKPKGVERRGPGAEYERILSELDTSIQAHEISLAEARITERRVSVYYFFYSLLFTFSIFAYLFFSKTSLRSPRSIAIDLAMVFLIPFVLYNGNKTIAWYYRRKIGGLETGLQTLRAKQKLKLEELKDSTAYYQTRGLIERFDPEFKTTNPTDGAQAKKQQSPKKEHPDGSHPNHHHLYHQQQQQQQQGTKSNEPSRQQQSDIAFVIHPEPKKGWMDRLVDAMIGDDSRNSKYAIICQRCHAHNGLALPDEILTLVHICPNCHFENKPKPRDNLTINGENVYTPTKDTDEAGRGNDPDTPQALKHRPNKSRLQH